MTPNKTINEGFSVGDLELVLDPVFTIDEFSSKVGNDDDVTVLSFIVRDKRAAFDLVDFLERGYKFVLDADVSNDNTDIGKYYVFVEMQRKYELPKNILRILSDLRGSSKIKLNEWKFRYVTDDKFRPVSEQEIYNHVPLSAKAYRRVVTDPLKNVQTLAGIESEDKSNKHDKSLDALRHGAGII